MGEHGIATVYDLRSADVALMRKTYGVVVERTIRELRGTPCIPLDDQPAPKKQFISSRSFSSLVESLDLLLKAITMYARIAATKLRSQGSAAGAMSVWIETNPFKPGEPQYHPSVAIQLVPSTDDTMQIIGAARAGVRRIFRDGYRYQKAGVMLDDLVPASSVQGDLRYRATSLLRPPPPRRGGTRVWLTRSTLSSPASGRPASRSPPRASASTGR